MLRHIPQVDDPRSLIDASTKDDAAVFRLSDDRALVATLDFFTPIVDDAYDFGRIAAANALSDVYAMGATPLFALNLVGWPRSDEMLELLGETLRGGADVAREAGIFVVGGHSIDDAEPKYGMVAIGEVHPDAVWANRGAQVGDVLLLTKPLGTGILATALKRCLIDAEAMTPAVESMAALNAGGAAAIRAAGDVVHAVTDVTGFGLLGHLHHILEASDTGAVIDAAALPVFDGVRELVVEGAVPGGTARNREAANEFTDWGQVGDIDQIIATDAQTSGGLLVAVSADGAEDLVRRLREQGTLAAAAIGHVTKREGTWIRFD